MKYLLGYEIGSSFINVSLLGMAQGRGVAAAHSPAQEMPIEVLRPSPMVN